MGILEPFLVFVGILSSWVWNGYDKNVFLDIHLLLFPPWVVARIYAG